MSRAKQAFGLIVGVVAIAGIANGYGNPAQRKFDEGATARAETCRAYKAMSYDDCLETLEQSDLDAYGLQRHR